MVPSSVALEIHLLAAGDVERVDAGGGLEEEAHAEVQEAVLVGLERGGGAGGVAGVDAEELARAVLDPGHRELIDGHREGGRVGRAIERADLRELERVGIEAGEVAHVVDRIDELARRGAVGIDISLQWNHALRGRRVIAGGEQEVDRAGAQIGRRAGGVEADWNGDAGAGNERELRRLILRQGEVGVGARREPEVAEQAVAGALVREHQRIGLHDVERDVAEVERVGRDVQIAAEIDVGGERDRLAGVERIVGVDEQRAGAGVGRLAALRGEGDGQRLEGAGVERERRRLRGVERELGVRGGDRAPAARGCRARCRGSAA